MVAKIARIPPKSVSKDDAEVLRDLEGPIVVRSQPGALGSAEGKPDEHDLFGQVVSALFNVHGR